MKDAKGKANCQGSADSCTFGQLASLHYLPQQHTSTAEHVSKEHADMADGTQPLDEAPAAIFVV